MHGGEPEQAQQLVLLMVVAYLLLPKPIRAAHHPGGAGKAAAAARQEFFYNEVTGEKQWEDPGGVAFEDDQGMRYWLAPSGERLSEDPAALTYAWVERYSEDMQRHYYYNQATHEATWERPADLAWRRVPLVRLLPPR